MLALVVPLYAIVRCSLQTLTPETLKFQFQETRITFQPCVVIVLYMLGVNQ